MLISLTIESCLKIKNNSKKHIFGKCNLGGRQSTDNEISHK
jgi:hypothetical protein